MSGAEILWAGDYPEVGINDARRDEYCEDVVE